MPPPEKKLLRLAAAIHKHHRSLSEHPVLPMRLPVNAWRRVERLERQLLICRQRGWQLAANQIRRYLLRSLAALQTEMQEIQSQLDAICPTCPTSVKDLYADLVALAEEFAEVEGDINAGSLSVETEPIVLEGLELGPFEIRLSWRHQYYTVIAKDANPASANSDVTHPHVQEERLCEGEGSSAIRAAMKEGRLYDFFLLVAGVLRTYNQYSPYVAIEDWEGIDCADCGGRASPDSRSICEKCGDTVCDECSRDCADCGRDLCSGCVNECPACGERRCASCLDVCAKCSAEVCTNCLDDQERCPTCHERDEENDDGEAEEAADEPALHPDRLGEAAVPA